MPCQFSFRKDVFQVLPDVLLTGLKELRQELLREPDVVPDVPAHGMRGLHATVALIRGDMSAVGTGTGEHRAAWLRDTAR